MSNEAFLVDAVRTPFGRYGGALKDLAPTELAGQIIREAVKRAKVDPKSVGTMVDKSSGKVLHKVRPGETLTSIASTYNTTVSALRRDNGKVASNLRAGAVLVINSSH